jgi:hypothetical protein
MKHAHAREGRAAARPYVITFCTLLFALCLFAFAVTYRVDPANGPDTLPTEVKEAFDAWVALSDKVEVSETQENPEGVFQYGDPARFGEDTLSLTVQRQADTRTISYLISPNADNRKRILLHETGIAIGLTPQIPGTPSATPNPSTPDGSTPDAPPPATPTTSGEGDDTFTTEPLPEQNTDSQAQDGDTTTEQAPTEEQTAQEQASEEQASEEQAGEGQTTEEQPTQDTGQDESSNPTEQTPTEETPAEEAPPAPALTPNSVMNPSIGAEDSTELGEAERALLEQLQLFVSEDINRDGAVNFYDLVALSQAFGRSGVNDPADINKDGFINEADVDELRQSYTFSDPSETPPGGSTSVTAEDNTAPEGTTNPDGTAPPEDSLPPEESLPPPDDGNSENSGE